MELAGLLMGFLILNLPGVGIIFVDLDTRQNPSVVCACSTFLLLCRGLCPYCKSLFPSLVVYLLYAQHPFASRCPLWTGFICRHQDFISRIMKAVIVLLQLSCPAFILDFPSLMLLFCLAEGQRSVHLVPV